MSDTGLEFKFGQTEQNMKVSGRIIWLKVKANFGTQMVIFMKENG